METLREAFAHHDWATRRLLDEAATCSDAELDRPFDLFRTGFATLRATLAHLEEAERLWLGRWCGLEAPPPATGLREAWEATAAARTRFVVTLPPGAGGRRVEGVTSGGEPFALPLGDTLLHVTNHGIHHRAQALAMLRQLGRRTPIGIDYLFLRGARPTVAWPDGMKRAWRDRGFPVPDEVETPARLDPGTLKEYLRYSDWATRRVIRAAAALDDEALDRSLPIGLRTLRRTLTHLRDAEAWWIANWTGKGDGTFQRLPDLTGLDELLGLFDASVAERDLYLDGCDERKLLSPVTVEPAPGAPLIFRVGESVMQLPTHGTHHRAQALAILRALGAEAPEVSYRHYAQQQGRAPS